MYKQMENHSSGRDQGGRAAAESAIRAAHVCRLRKDLWGAIAEADRATKADPSYLPAHEYLAELYTRLCIWDKAIAALQQAQALSADPERQRRIERLEEDQELFEPPLMELVRERPLGWKGVLKSIFQRPDSKWYRTGRFNLALCASGLALFTFTIYMAIQGGTWVLLFAMLQIVIMGWMYWDARMHGEPAYFWAVVGGAGSVFGLILYLVIRGMSSGIGMGSDTRFFQG
jgi:tetratricopeptide (TPR) repeat protein